MAITRRPLARRPPYVVLISRLTVIRQRRLIELRRLPTATVRVHLRQTQPDASLSVSATERGYLSRTEHRLQSVPTLQQRSVWSSQKILSVFRKDRRDWRRPYVNEISHIPLNTVGWQVNKQATKITTAIGICIIVIVGD